MDKMLPVEIYSSNRIPSGLVNLVKLLEDTTAQHFTLTMSVRHGEKERFTTQETGETPSQLNVVSVFWSHNAMSINVAPAGSAKFDFTKLLKHIAIICELLVRKLKIIHILFILHWVLALECSHICWCVRYIQTIILGR